MKSIIVGPHAHIPNGSTNQTLCGLRANDAPISRRLISCPSCYETWKVLSRGITEFDFRWELIRKDEPKSIMMESGEGLI